MLTTESHVTRTIEMEIQPAENKISTKRTIDVSFTEEISNISIVSTLL